MRKIRNKEVLRRLSYRILEAKKKKNLIAVLAIILTTVLFTAVFVVGGSIVTITQENTMRQVGSSAHVGFKNMLPSDYEDIAEDPEVKDSSYDIFVGFLTDEVLNKLQCEVRYYQEKQARWNFSYPKEGKMPEAEDEIAVSTLVLDALGLPYELGTELLLTVQTDRQSIEKTFRLCGFWEGDPVAGAQQCLVSRAFCEQAAPVPLEDYNTYMLNRDPSMAYAPTGYCNVSVWFSNTWNLEQKAEDLRIRLGYGEEVHVGVNWAYGMSSVDLGTVVLVAGVLFLITLSGYLIIYNIFYINIYSDIRFYGLLKTIGTTGRQLGRIVRRQALLLCLVGIPIGLAIGYLLGRYLVPVALQMAEYNEAAFQISASPLIFVGAALFSLFTVLISSHKPCKVAARVSPMEAVRYSEVEVTGKKKGKKTRKISPMRMAVGNLGRNRRKFLVTVLSLSLSMILLNSVYTVVTGFSMEDYIADQVAGDVSVTWVGIEHPANTGGYLEWEAVKPEVLKELSALPGVEAVSPIYLVGTKGTLLASGHWERMEEILKEAPFLKDLLFATSVEDMLKEKYYDAQIYGVDPGLWEDIKIEEGIFDPEKFASGDYIIVNRYGDSEDSDFVRSFYHVGEKVKLEIPGREGAEPTLREFEVMAIGEVPHGMSRKGAGLIDETFILPNEVLLPMIGEDRGAMRAVLDVEEEQLPQVEEWIAEYCSTEHTDLTYVSRATYEKEFRNMQMTFGVIGGLLSLILGIIGILNFINAIVTSILVRRQELAMMEAVGMTGKQLRSMLQWEGAGYALVTFFVCLTLGTLVSFTGVQLIGRQMAFFRYHFTLLPLMICMPLLLGLSVLVPVLAYKNTCRTSVVERIRRME